MSEDFGSGMQPGSLRTDGGETVDKSSHGTDRYEEYAHYECSCGDSIRFHPDEFDRLRWLRSKFGYKNIPSAIDDIRDCCDRPDHIECSLHTGGGQS